MNAVLLAGGPLDDVARLQPGAPNKAFVDIGGRTLAGRVLIALRGSPSVGRIVVVAPPSTWGHDDLRAADDRGQREDQRLRDRFDELHRVLNPAAVKAAREAKLEKLKS